MWQKPSMHSDITNSSNKLDGLSYSPSVVKLLDSCLIERNLIVKVEHLMATHRTNKAEVSQKGALFPQMFNIHTLNKLRVENSSAKSVKWKIAINTEKTLHCSSKFIIDD